MDGEISGASSANLNIRAWGPCRLEYRKYLDIIHPAAEFPFCYRSSLCNVQPILGMYVHYAYIWSVHDQCLSQKKWPAKGTHCMLNPPPQFSRWLGQCQGGDEGCHVPGFGLRLRHSGPVPPPSALHDRRAPWLVTHFPSFGGF